MSLFIYFRYVSRGVGGDQFTVTFIRELIKIESSKPYTLDLRMSFFLNMIELIFHILLWTFINNNLCPQGNDLWILWKLYQYVEFFMSIKLQVLRAGLISVLLIISIHCKHIFKLYHFKKWQWINKGFLNQKKFIHCGMRM